MSGPNGDRRTTSALTPEQARALEVRGASVALSAGAGCGKTTVLTARFLGELEGESARPLRALVAVTFTEKAARELRQRIRQACHDRLAVATAEEAARWRTVLRGLEAAPVSTFHEYCAHLLRRHALTAGIDPDFEVLDATLAAAVRDEALDRCVRRWLAAVDDDFVALAVDSGLAAVHDAVDGLVARRDADELDRWAAATPDDLIAAWERAWAGRGLPSRLRALARRFRDLPPLLTANPCRHATLESRKGAIVAGLVSLESARNPAAVLEALLEDARLHGARASHWTSAEVHERVKGRLEALRNDVKKLLSRLEIDADATRRAAEDGLRYARLAVAARDEYRDAKRVRGGLDFDDLLIRTRDLLREHPGVLADGGGGVEFVLVDEFQDTDPVQAEILRRIAGDAFASGGLFVVGDFKQSIYRFRGARPQLFQDVRAELPEAGRLELSANFRSTPAVIDFVNALFAEAFRGETPRLVAGAPAPPTTGPAVEFVWAHEPDGPSSAENLRRVEARWLARLVRSRLDAGWLVRDRESKQLRRAHGGDVAFLFRAMTTVGAYEQALAAEGLDYHVVGGSAFYAQQEVQDLINVLSVVEDPFDAVSLAGALRGPFFGMSDEALYWLGEPGSGGLAARFLNADDTALARLSPEDAERARRARALLDEWSDLKDRVPIAALVDHVLASSGYEASLLGEFLGDRKRANARKLVRMARQFDGRGGFTLAHFVARLRADLHDPPREEQAATTDEEGTSVRLMSVHQSKGLEFPIVVVPDLNRQSDRRRDRVAFDPELGPVVRPVAEVEESSSDGSGESLGRLALHAIEDEEDEAESLRLFYVATTRARDALILSAGGPADAKLASPALRLLDERFDRATGSLADDVTLPDGWPTPVVGVLTECPALPPGVSPAAPRRGLKLGPAIRVIESTPLSTAASDPARPTPRRLDLDAARGLAPHAARLDRLIRAVLHDPAAVRPGGLDDALRRAARRQCPVAHGGLVDEAHDLLSPWLGGPVGEQVRRASDVLPGWSWTVRWPDSAPRGGTVVHGRADLLTRDPRGEWSPLIFRVPGASETLASLRAALTFEAVRVRGLGPVAPGWIVVLGEGHGLRGVEPPSHGEIRSLFEEALQCLARPDYSVSRSLCLRSVP